MIGIFDKETRFIPNKLFPLFAACISLISVSSISFLLIHKLLCTKSTDYKYSVKMIQIQYYV